ncbi:hypothetical protein I4U23_031334 [Adineta vaga]|nr:hypothetical protein I4U23_031334 [Adineta vaga]
MFEQLTVELIRSIFEYLSPLDLVNAFKELNSRFSSIIRRITQQELSPKFELEISKVLRRSLVEIRIELRANVQWKLNYCGKIYCCDQLEEFIVEGYLRFNENADLPRANVLQQWLMMSKLKKCNVRFDFRIFCYNQIEQNFDDLLSNYEKIFGQNSVYQKKYILIHYPNSMKTIPISNDEDVNDLIDELEIDESDYLKDKWIETVQNIYTWFNLRKISILGDCTTDENAICRNLSTLLHVVQRATHFSELEVQATLAFGLVLSSNIELCRYLADHLEVLRFCGEGRTCSFLQLVEIVDKIYSHSSSLSFPLKKLTIFVDADPSPWFTINHFQKGLQLVFDRFPSLIHFTLYCSRSERFNNTLYDLNQLLSEWYSGMNYGKSWSWRSKSNSFDLWL